MLAFKFRLKAADIEVLTLLNVTYASNMEDKVIVMSTSDQEVLDMWIREAKAANIWYKA